jgi:D-amino-acid dehydrogenase
MALRRAGLRRYLKDGLGGLQRRASGWRIETSDGPMEAAQAVAALGAASAEVTQQFGYAPPLFGKRGYHMHYSLRGNETPC